MNRDFFVQSAFKEFTYWNYDRDPSKNDALTQAVDWINIAKVLHEPLPPQEEAVDDNVKVESIKEE